MKNCKRAIRRHHYQRLKKKRAEYYGGWYRDRPESIAMMVDTPTPCSCYMCGNPRRMFGELSTQERRHNEDVQKALDAEGLILHQGQLEGDWYWGCDIWCACADDYEERLIQSATPTDDWSLTRAS